jgi:cobalt/nickel transport system permease protein
MTEILDTVSEDQSIFHRMDPRLKLVGFGVFLFVTASLKTPAAALTALLLAAGAVRLSRIPLAFVLRRTLPVVLFLSTFFLILPFTHPQGWLAGILQATVIVLRGMAMVLTIFPMFWTAPLHRSMKALERLRLSPRLVTLLLLTIRYVGTYDDQLRRLRTALAAGGFRARRDFKTLKTVGGLVGLLLLRSFEKTERIYQAMLCRGYAGSVQRIDDFGPISSVDRGRFGALLLLSVALVVFDRLLRGGG